VFGRGRRRVFARNQDFRTAAEFRIAVTVDTIWHFDLGLNVARGFSRQVFRREEGLDRYSQGFAVLIGPTVDIFVTERLFLGAEVDIVLNTQRSVCQRRGSQTNCIVFAPRRVPAPAARGLDSKRLRR